MTHGLQLSTQTKPPKTRKFLFTITFFANLGFYELNQLHPTNAFSLPCKTIYWNHATGSMQI